MSRVIDGQALDILTKTMGLTGPGEQQTQLTDGIVDQSLDIAPIVRRSRTLNPSEGIFTASMTNVHTDAESLTTAVDMYRLGTGITVPPFPAAVNNTFEIWLLGAGLSQISGGGTLNAILDLQLRAQAFGVDDSGVAVVSTPVMPLVHWDALVSEGLTFGVTAGGELPYAPIGIRIPRHRLGAGNGPILTFRSTSSITTSFRCLLWLGLFPVALGQDAVV